MRAVALLPCAAILTGACLGVYVVAPEVVRWALPAVWMATAASWWRARRGSTAHQPHWSAAIIALLASGFLVSSWVLAAHARDATLHTPIRAVVAVDGTSPANARFVLREDAAVTGPGASLRVRMLAVNVEGRWRDVDGGVTVTVGGQPSA